MKWIRRFCIALLCISITGCVHLTTSRPNPTYVANIPSLSPFLSSQDKREITKIQSPLNARAYKSFEEIFKLEQKIAIELGRIPELQDGINENEVIALENFVEFLKVATENEKKALEEILAIGKPGYRKFCSPLQALFWLAEKGELNREKNPLQDYSLDKLLVQAWTFMVEFSEEEAIAIIRNLKNREKSEEMLIEYRNGEISLKTLNQYFNIERGDEEEVEALYQDKKIFSKYKGKDKWGDFDTVVERLNSPELVDYYQRKNFSYQDRGRDSSGSAYQIFKTKSGQCVDHTQFAVWCLRKAGYNAFELHVSSPTMRFSYHAVCMFEDKGKWFIMDNGRSPPYGICEAKKYRQGY